jgi:hypothetical protein
MCQLRVHVDEGFFLKIQWVPLGLLEPWQARQRDFRVRSKVTRGYSQRDERRTF